MKCINSFDTHKFCLNLLSHFLELVSQCFWEVWVTILHAAAAACAARSPWRCILHSCSTAVQQLQPFCKLQLPCRVADNCMQLLQLGISTHADTSVPCSLQQAMQDRLPRITGIVRSHPRPTLTQGTLFEIAGNSVRSCVASVIANFGRT